MNPATQPPRDNRGDPVSPTPSDTQDVVPARPRSRIGRTALAAYGLKWNPFTPDLPAEACLISAPLQVFCLRVEALASTGGFALVTGEPGMGKSVALRVLQTHLGRLPDLAVRVLTRPQSSLADFHRELGDLYGVPLKPHNRWARACSLRQRWHEHAESVLYRSVLLVDEAQEMQPSVLIELRLLASCELDARTLLTVALAGDDRLTASFRKPELMSLGTRIRARLALGHASPEELQELLRHATSEAGNASLLTEELIRTLPLHAAGNPRILMVMAAELLEQAIRRNVPQIDEKLYMEVFAAHAEDRRPRRRSQAGSCTAESDRRRERTTATGVPWTMACTGRECSTLSTPSRARGTR